MRQKQRPNDRNSISHRILLSVRRRIQCGIGLFCFCFLPKVTLVRNDLWEGCGINYQHIKRDSKARGGEGRSGVGVREIERVISITEPKPPRTGTFARWI